MPLELFTFIFVSPSIFFLGCLVGGRPKFFQTLSQIPRGLCHEIPGNRWPVKRENLLRRSRMLAEERESTSRAPVLENGGTKSRTTQNGRKPNPPNGTLLPGRTNSALGAGFCQCLNLNF